MLRVKMRRVPRTFQELNDLFNMGKFVWETGKPKSKKDSKLPILLMEDNNKKKFKKNRK